MKVFKDIFAIFFPEICACCDAHLLEMETAVCVVCRHELGSTGFSFESNNLLEKSFYGRIPLVSATALFYFLKKGKIQRLIHQLKYKGQQHVGIFAGNWLGDEILESHRFSGIDQIIPVPLHPYKLKKRGYNQLTAFGQTLSQKLKKPYNDRVLIKVSATQTQTKKMRLDRWKNVRELFKVQNPLELENTHVLLIDDIITTGATLEACYEALRVVKNLKISLACIAYTK
jgi:ComF family protein